MTSVPSSPRVVLVCQDYGPLGGLYDGAAPARDPREVRKAAVEGLISLVIRITEICPETVERLLWKETEPVKFVNEVSTQPVARGPFPPEQIPRHLPTDVVADSSTTCRK